MSFLVAVDSITRAAPSSYSTIKNLNARIDKYQSRFQPSSTTDETDNKTSNSPVFFRKTVMSDNFRSESERLKTFEFWSYVFIDKHILACTGMFHTGDEDKVKCFFCEVEIGRWEITDHPVSEHIKWSPNCPLMRRRTTNNIPISPDALDRLLPPASYDVCGSNEAIEVRPTAYAEGSITFGNNLTATTTATSSSSNYQMEYPEYAIEGARVRSFTEWPRTMRQKPQQLAEAGFFYTGVGDRVNCFSCGGGLKDWDENDEPWEQHAQWLGKCRYMKLMKGEAFVDSVKAKFRLEAEKYKEAYYAACDMEVQECGTQTEGRQQNSGTTTRAVATTATATATSTAPTTPTVYEELLQRSDSNSSEKKTIPEEKLCKICYAAEYSTAFMPCGHVVACAKCASSVTKCPMCREPFTDVMRVYFS